jgi:hypothetical protein
MLNLIRRFLVLFLLIGVYAGTAYAANHYVRPGSTGNNSGSDWTNAYPNLPSTLVRGDTYYLADGTYGSRTFRDPNSGSSLIIIKKATQADHGTSTGWQTGYGDGQAVFNSVIRFETGNYVLDGKTRNESDWFDGASYGIRVNHNGQDQNIVIAGGSVSSNITIKYVFVDAIYGNLPGTTLRRYAIDTDTYGGSIATGLVFHRMYVYGSNNVWFLRTTNGAVVEYSASNGVTGNAANHGEIVNLFYSGNNAVIRYNKFKNAYLEGGGTALVAITYADGLQFYGNIVSNFSVGDGAVGFNGYYSSRNRVYNNTFVNGLAASGVAWGSGTDNQVYNNLFVNCKSVGLEGSHDYNQFINAGDAHGEPNGRSAASGDPFVNAAGFDFRLKAATAPGLALSAPFNKDMNDAMRGADGVWDRGAFEYVVGSPPPTSSSESIFTTQTPASLSLSDGANINYELGTRFLVTKAGQIKAIRFYKSPSESGTHTGRIYISETSGPRLIASVTFTNETASGWQMQNFITPLSIAANTEYIVTVNTGNTYYVATNQGLSTQVASGSLRTMVGNNGIFRQTGYGWTSWENSNYFRDVVFVPSL